MERSWTPVPHRGVTFSSSCRSAFFISSFFFKVSTAAVSLASSSFEDGRTFPSFLVSGASSAGTSSFSQRGSSFEVFRSGVDPEKLAHSRTLMFLFMNTLFAGLLLVKTGGGGADEAAFSVVVVVGGGGGELVVGGEVSTRTTTTEEA